MGGRENTRGDLTTTKEMVQKRPTDPTTGWTAAVLVQWPLVGPVAGILDAYDAGTGEDRAVHADQITTFHALLTRNTSDAQHIAAIAKTCQALILY